MNRQFLEDYFLNRLTADEQERVAAWMRDPANETALQQLMHAQWESEADSNTPLLGKEAIWRNVQLAIQQEVAETVAAETPVTIKPHRFKRFAVAAAMFLIMAGSFLVYRMVAKNDDYNLAGYGSNLVTTVNQTGIIKKIVLEDGSTVVLNPEASLTYPVHFGASNREVSLTGDAFFEVTKNPAKPFLVYSNNITTKVLGTSFTISSNAASRNIKVAVHTGRVQVFESVTTKGVVDNKSTNGVIITANQQTIYSQTNNSFVTSLVADPAPIAGMQTAGYFDFNRQPVAEVMKRIETVYGIEIVMEHEALGKCVFTGELAEENLYEKLDILCKTINAAYEITGTKVLLKGTGCP